MYIHCAVGVGRSATLLACWYIYAKGMSVAQVLRLLKLRRPQVGLTRRQVRRLQEFEAQLEQNSYAWLHEPTTVWPTDIH